MSETLPELCEAEWAAGCRCPHPVPDVPPAFRSPGFRRQAKCYLHRRDNALSKALCLLSERGYTVLLRCPEGCRQYGGGFGCDCRRADGRPAKPRRRTYCRYEVEAAIDILRLSLEQLMSTGQHLTPQHFRRLADLCTARLILGRLESRLAERGLVEEITSTSDNGERTTSGRVSSFLAARARLLSIVRQDERDLGLFPPCRRG